MSNFTARVRSSGVLLKQVVDRRRDRLTRDEDHVCAGHAQQHQHAQHPLLVMVHARDLRQLFRVEREAGNHYRGARGARVRKYPPEQGRQPFLDLREAPKFLGGAWGRHTHPGR
jgi:hypothetical protein